MTKIIKEPKDLYGFLPTPGIEVMNLAFASDDVVRIAWKYGAEEQVPSLLHTTEVIGAYLTAGARIHLYRYLHRLGENGTYCDTDSVICIQPRDRPPLIETWDKLGDMTSELRPSGSISEFTRGGPKNYAHRVVNTVTGAIHTVCKMRGITLNYSASKLVNFDVIRHKILKRNTGNEPRYKCTYPKLD